MVPPRELPDQHYDYPEGRDWRPGSALSRKLVNDVMNRATAARRHMSSRFSDWDEVDDLINLRVELDEEELAVQKKDPRRPVSLIVPTLRTVREVITAYACSILFTNPMFRYNHLGPEDLPDVAKLERLVYTQSSRFRHSIGCRTQIADCLTYGIGAATPMWQTKKGRIWKTVPVTEYDSQTGQVIATGETERQSAEGIIAEGSEYIGIHPKNLLLDPMVCEYEVHEKGDFAGFLARLSLVNVVDWEASSDGRVFNAKYLKFLAGTNRLTSDIAVEADADSGTLGSLEDSELQSLVKPIDIVYMYRYIIPHDYGLSDSTTPETWFFAIAADDIVILAEKIETDCYRFPLFVAVPDTDGHTVAPVSRLEALRPLAMAIDWLYNNMMYYNRKGVGSIVAYDQTVINERDLMRKGPLKYVRLMRPVWGHKLTEFIAEVPLRNTTQSQAADLEMTWQLAERTSAVSDMRTGRARQGSERITATEIQGILEGSGNRLQDFTNMMSLMAMHPMGVQLALNTQNFMTQETTVSIMGRWEAQLREIYPEQDSMDVEPGDIRVQFDFLPVESFGPEANNAAAWVEYIKTLAANPVVVNELIAKYDVPRMMEHVYRLLGMRDVGEFRRPVVLTPEQVQGLAGNTTQPIGGAPDGRPL